MFYFVMEGSSYFPFPSTKKTTSRHSDITYPKFKLEKMRKWKAKGLQISVAALTSTNYHKKIMRSFSFHKHLTHKTFIQIFKIMFSDKKNKSSNSYLFPHINSVRKGDGLKRNTRLNEARSPIAKYFDGSSAIR